VDDLDLFPAQEVIGLKAVLPHRRQLSSFGDRLRGRTS
jgi:hypothetical protein